MATVKAPALPLAMYCEGCGRRWVQTEAWPTGTLLLCECGLAAYAEQARHTANHGTRKR